MFLDAYAEKRARVDRVSADMCTVELLQDRAGARSLFLADGASEVILLDTPGEKAEAREAVLASAAALSESANIFVLLEGKLLAPLAKELKKHAVEYHEVEGAPTGEKFNAFALADALACRDKKLLWVLFLRSRNAGLSPEEIIGTLFWQIKSMRLAAKTKSASEAGIKPFVYSKSKRGAEKFKPGELDTLSRSLITIYHDAHLGLLNLDLALERWVLGV
jgi:alkylhydroperoxidase/carboxymuconolactone decarboxylase family protein YurZ